MNYSFAFSRCFSNCSRLQLFGFFKTFFITKLGQTKILCTFVFWFVCLAHNKFYQEDQKWLTFGIMLRNRSIMVVIVHPVYSFKIQIYCSRAFLFFCGQTQHCLLLNHLVKRIKVPLKNRFLLSLLQSIKVSIKYLYLISLPFLVKIK